MVRPFLLLARKPGQAKGGRVRKKEKLRAGVSQEGMTRVKMGRRLVGNLNFAIYGSS